MNFENKPALKIDNLKLTDGVKSTLIALLNDQNASISYSPSRLWGGYGRHPLIGAWVIRNTHFGYEKVQKTHGRVILALFDAGLLEIDYEHDPENNFTFLRLSDQALSNIRKIRQRAMFTQTMVKREALDALAAQYGLKVDYSQRRNVFTISSLEGVEIPEEYRWISKNSKGVPIFKYSDLSWFEWDDLFYQVQQALLTR
ncbi:hypothetical protein ACWU37_20995 (plasmid) [Photobacterium damselae subsp. damselae]|uniref:hypothetical protein n=1 Tax=Photobacterium damselae TaxID=38293 RepID=UPI001F367241|nr:hypothetical protein [Photobacterium damselae]UKA12821.1 hypothetical protein IHC91_21245 [Photobacterium damselae subsp. damselae]